MPEQSTSRRAKSVAANARSAPAMRPLCALRIRTRYARSSNECSGTRQLPRYWLGGTAHVRGAPALSRIQAAAPEVGAFAESAAARGRSVRSTASVTRQQFTLRPTTQHDMKRGPEHAVPVEPVHTCGSASGSPAPQTLFEVPRGIQCCRHVFQSTDALGAWSLIEVSERPKATVLLLDDEKRTA